MKIYAFADEACPMIDGQIAAMKRNGLNGLEIRGVDGQNISDISLEKAKEVREKLDAAGLIVWSIGSPLGKVGIRDDFAAHLEKTRHTCEIAQILGTRRIRMFSFYLPKEADFDSFEDEVVEKLSRMLAVAEEYGITLCHENEKGIFGDTAARCQRLFARLPKLQGVFDPANFLQCKEDTVKAFELLCAHTDYLHIKDCLADGSVVPAGKGVGHLNQIVKKALAMGITDMTIEPHLTVFDGLKNLEQAGEESKVGCYVYESGDAALDAACNALKEILEQE